jgi:hypothetical protein
MIFIINGEYSINRINRLLLLIEIQCAFGKLNLQYYLDKLFRLRGVILAGFKEYFGCSRTERYIGEDLTTLPWSVRKFSSFIFIIQSCIMTGYTLADPYSIPFRGRNFFLRHHIHTGWRHTQLPVYSSLYSGAERTDLSVSSLSPPSVEAMMYRNAADTVDKFSISNATTLPTQRHGRIYKSL